MSWILFSFLLVLCLAMMAHGLAMRGRFYELPFFAAAIFLCFVMPQLPALINAPFIKEAALQKTIFLSGLCLGMCWLGWAWGVRGQSRWDIAFDEKRLTVIAAVLSATGGYFFLKIGDLPDEQRLRSMMTGTAVAYMFFAKLLTYGFAIALIVYAWRKSGWALAIILFDSAFYMQRIFIAGRRGETAEFLLLIALAFWFQRRWSAPRLAVIAGIIFAMVGLLAADQYRAATFYSEKPDWNAVFEIDLVEKWDRLLQEGGSEMVNVVAGVDHIEDRGNYNYGVENWNNLVFVFVPAQLFGSDFKDSLYIDMPAFHDRGYQVAVGSTLTGMLDVFAAFWYIGALKFLILAFVLGRIYSAAMRGNTAMQVAYMLSAVPSILMITHYTNELVIAWIHMAAFLVPTMALAMTSRPAQLLPQAR